MRKKSQVSYRGFVLLAAFLLTVAGVGASQNTAPNKEQKDDSAAFKEFAGRIDQYVKMRKNIEKQLPAMKSKEELPEMIAAHQLVLARKIREARPAAKPGDMFTHDVREAFRHVIQSVFKDTRNTIVRSTGQQRKTVKQVSLKVNGIYPDAAAETTFPSALLQKLPALPDELAYRIAGRSLVLVDSKAHLVLDIFHEALP